MYIFMKKTLEFENVYWNAISRTSV